MFLRVGLAADSVCSLSPLAGRGSGRGGLSVRCGSPSPDALRAVADALASASLALRTPAEGRLCSPRKRGEVTEFAAPTAGTRAIVLCPNRRSQRYCATFVSWYSSTKTYRNRA